MISLVEVLSNYDRAFKGIAVSGYPLVTVVDDFRVFKGANVRDAVPLYTIVGNRLFKGLQVSGAPIATLSGDRIFKGWNVAGMPIARMKGRVSIKGTALAGPALVTVPSKNIKTLFAATYHALYG